MISVQCTYELKHVQKKNIKKYKQDLLNNYRLNIKGKNLTKLLHVRKKASQQNIDVFMYWFNICCKYMFMSHLSLQQEKKIMESTRAQKYIRIQNSIELKLFV